VKITLLKWFVGILLVLGLLITLAGNFVVNISLVRADMRINQAQMVHATIKQQNDLRDVTYLGLAGDFCGLLSNKDYLIIKYTLGPSIEGYLPQLESLMQNEYAQEHKRLFSECNLDRPYPFSIPEED